MERRRGPPSQGWRTFLRNHAPHSGAVDEFVVPSIGFKLLYGLVILRLERRQLVWANFASASGAPPPHMTRARVRIGSSRRPRRRSVSRSAPKTETAATASFANLPRLPETADEVRNVAIALKAGAK